MPKLQYRLEEPLIRDAATRFLADRVTNGFVQRARVDPEAAHRSLWPELSGLAWPSLLVAERFGGLDANASTVCALMEEMGAACMPGPYFSSAILSALLIQQLATEHQRERLLPELASGKQIYTCAIQEGRSDLDPESIRTVAVRDGDTYCLQGEKILVMHADLVDRFVLVARVGTHATDTFGVFILAASTPGINVVQLAEMQGKSSSRVLLSGVKVSAADLLGGRAYRWQDILAVLLQGSLFKSAEMFGAAGRALDMTVAYARERQQFGRAIGSFQAVQHHCANMLVQVLSLHTMLVDILETDDLTHASLFKLAKVKLWANQAYREVIRLAHQVFAGIAYMENHIIASFFRHCRQAETECGDSLFLLDFVASNMFNIELPEHVVGA